MWRSRYPVPPSRWVTKWCGSRIKTPMQALVPDNVRLVPAFSSTLYQNQIGIAGRVLRPIVGDRHFLRKVLRERSWEVYLRRKIPSRMFDGDRIAEFAAALQIQRPTPRDRLIVHSGSPQTVNILTTWASRRPQSTHPSFHIRTCWSKSNMPFRGLCRRIRKGHRTAGIGCTARHAVLRDGRWRARTCTSNWHERRRLPAFC